jgi:site-specific recombinase XerD
MNISNFLQLYGDMMQMRQMSFNTQESYFYHLKKFMDFTPEQIDKYSSHHIRNYLIYLNGRGVSDSYFNQSINAIKFAFIYVLNRKIKDYMVLRPKRAKTQPIILDKSEVLSLLKACDNKKHKAILMLFCTTGMRISEVINLKIKDIDSLGGVIHIVQSKGRKDRLVPLDNDCLNILREYFKEYRPVDYLFNGSGNNYYSESSIRQFLKKYANVAGIKKRIYPHLLRHTYLTELLEDGNGIHEVKIVAGHQRESTTSAYIHLSPKFISQIKSPLQNINL